MEQCRNRQKPKVQMVQRAGQPVGLHQIEPLMEPGYPERGVA